MKIEEHPDFLKKVDDAFAKAAAKHVLLRRPWWCFRSIFHGVLAGLLVIGIIYVTTEGIRYAVANGYFVVQEKGKGNNEEAEG